MGLAETMQIVVTGDTSKYERAMKQTRTQTQQTTQYVERTWTEMSNRIVKVLGAITVGYGVKQIASSFLEVGFSVDRISRSMEAATGSARESAAAQAFLRAESERLGLVYRDQIQDYQKLAAAARGTNLEGKATRDIYLSIAEASTALQLSTDQTSGAIMAVTQMISKGKVQAEELRGQLGERLPGAFQIAAKAMGTTTAGLSEMLDKGEVYADVFLPRFAQALRERFAGSIESASQSATANLNRFHNTWFDLQKTVMESGVMTEISLQLKNIGAEFKTWLEQNRELIKQKVPEYLNDIKSGVTGIYNVASNMKAIIDALPGDALEWGLIGYLLLKGKGPAAKVVAAITAINEGMQTFNMNLGSFVTKYNSFSEAYGNIIDVFQGERHWNTGEMIPSSVVRMPMPARPNPTTIRMPIPARPAASTAAASAVPFDEKAFKAKLTALDDEAKIYLKSFDDYREWELKWYSDRQKMAEKDADREKKAAEKSLKDQEKLAADRLNAYRDMYGDLGDLSEKNYDFQRDLLYKQYDEFVRITGDYALAAEWLARKEKDLLRERTLRHGDFFAGIRQGFEDLVESEKSWAQRTHDIVISMAETTRGTLSDLLFDAVTGDLKTFADYWDSIWKSMVRSTTDMVADMAISAGTSLAKDLMGSVGSSLGSYGGDIVDWLFGAQGIWSIPRRGDEVPVIAHEGEMIIPKYAAEALRAVYGDFAGMVGGANLGVTGAGITAPGPQGSRGITEIYGPARATQVMATVGGSVLSLGGLFGSLPSLGGFISSVARGVSGLFSGDAYGGADFGGAGFATGAGMVGSGAFAYEGGSWATGTGPRGLPKTGLYFGHQGEIVLNPMQSELLRRASSRGDSGLQLNAPLVYIESMSGTETDIKSLVSEIDYRLTKLWKRRTN